MSSGFDSVSNSGAVVASATASWAHVLGGGSNLVLVVPIASADATTLRTVLSVTYGAQSLSQIPATRKVDPSGTAFTEEWGLIAPVGNQTITVTLSGITTAIMCGAVVAKDADQASPFVNGSTNSGASASASVTVASALDQMTVAVVLENTNGVSEGITTTGAQVQRYNVNIGANTIASAAGTIAGSASAAHTWTLTNAGDDWSASGISIKAGPTPGVALEESGYYVNEPQTNPITVSTW